MRKTRLFPFVLPALSVFIFGAILIYTAPQRVEKLKSTYEVYELFEIFVRYGMRDFRDIGHKAIYEDFISIWLLQTLMQEGIKKEADPLIAQIRSVIRHEPKLETTYMLACFVMLNELKRPEFCQEINLAGLRAFPMSWRLLMTQAYVEYSAMNHPAQAASFFTMAAQRENAPDYVKKAAKKLLETRTLTDEDIKASMGLIAEKEGNSQFRQLLESIQQNKREGTHEQSAP